MFGDIERPWPNQDGAAMQTVTRLIGALALLAITAFSIFGFMATYEY